MPQLSTFGIEAEFQEGAADVISGLHSLGLAGDGILHGYHCDCPTCELGNDYPLKGQTDSSCSGEIISDVMTFDPDSETLPWLRDHNPLNVFQSIEDVAVEADAEPGLNAGLHVHVGIQHQRDNSLDRVMAAYVKWEPLLVRIAQGRWNILRDMNHPVRVQLAGEITRFMRVVTSNHYYVENDGRLWRDAWNAVQDEVALLALQHHLGAVTGDQQALFGRFMRNVHMNHDRHSYLNIEQHRNPTWEFRLWNSTRSAWRLEMFARVSIALMDPAVADRLLAEPYPQRIRRETLYRFARILSECEHDAAAGLVERQAYYLAHRAENAPSTLTALS